MSEPDHTKSVLFVCSGNSARSILAEAIMNREGLGRFKAWSAGSEPKGEINPHVLQLLKTLHYPTDALRSKSWTEMSGSDAPHFDFVFYLCEVAAAATPPEFTGHPMSAHWTIPDPTIVEGTEAEVGLAFADSYRLLYNRITLFMNLPMSKLDRLTMQSRLDEIGKSGTPRQPA